MATVSEFLAPFGTMNAHPVETPLDDYAAGERFIIAAGGVLISYRRGVDGGPIETYRVRLADGDVLFTYGQYTIGRPWRVLVQREKSGNSTCHNPPAC